MAKTILICGKVCSGKPSYARRLREAHPAVLLPTAEVTHRFEVPVKQEMNERVRAENEGGSIG